MRNILPPVLDTGVASIEANQQLQTDSFDFLAGQEACGRSLLKHTVIDFTALLGSNELEDKLNDVSLYPDVPQVNEIEIDDSNVQGNTGGGGSDPKARRMSTGLWENSSPEQMGIVSSGEMRPLRSCLKSGTRSGLRVKWAEEIPSGKNGRKPHRHDRKRRQKPKNQASLSKTHRQEAISSHIPFSSMLMCPPPMVSTVSQHKPSI